MVIIKIIFQCFAFSRKSTAFPPRNLKQIAKYWQSLPKNIGFPATSLFSHHFHPRFCELTQTVSGERKSLVRERKSIEYTFSSH